MTDRLTADQEKIARDIAADADERFSDGRILTRDLVQEIDATRAELDAVRKELAEAKTREAACIADAQRIIREQDMLVVELKALGKEKP